MNILVLCHEYPPLGGGGGIGAKQYADAWAAKGHRVTVLTSWAKGLGFRERIDEVDVIRVVTCGRQSRATASFNSMLSYIVCGYAHVLVNRHKFRGIHIVNSHFAVPTGPLGFLVSKTLRIPHILTIIGGDVYDPTKPGSPHKSRVLQRVNAFIINSADRVVAISSDTKKRAETYYKINKQIDVINYGFIPVKLSQPRQVQLRRDNGQYYIVGVGRLIPRKGFDHLIRCLELLPRNVHLIIIGDGPLEGHLRDVAARSKVSERVMLAGYMSRDHILEYLQLADCFVLSSLHEGMGIVVQEAMYVGLPIVSTDNGGQTDLIREGRNGILVRPGDIQMLSGAIERFFKDRELSESVARNNREDIKKYDMAMNCVEYLEIFWELIGERESRVEDRELSVSRMMSTREDDTASRCSVDQEIRLESVTADAVGIKEGRSDHE